MAAVMPAGAVAPADRDAGKVSTSLEVKSSVSMLNDCIAIKAFKALGRDMKGYRNEDKESLIRFCSYSTINFILSYSCLEVF